MEFHSDGRRQIGRFSRSASLGQPWVTSLQEEGRPVAPGGNVIITSVDVTISLTMFDNRQLD